MRTEVDRPASHATLAARIGGDGPAVTLVHGFSQTGSCLGPLATELRRNHRVACVDAPGHGGSALHASADIADGAALLAATGGIGSYVGYSMGARLCLRAALDAPDEVRSLVLVGGTPGIADNTERLERRASDERRAARLLDVGLDAFIDDWLAAPMFAGLAPWARFDEERRSNRAVDLAQSLQRSGTATMDPLWDRLRDLAMPVLCLTGARDERFGDIATQMVEAIGANAEHVVIDGAGHAAHLENPSDTTEAVQTFLERHGC